MEYIEIKNGTIIGHYDGQSIPKGDQYISTPDFNGIVGMDLKMIDLDKGGQIKPTEQLVSEELISDNRGKYYNKTNKQEHIITELNVEPEKNLTTEKPQTSEQYEIFDESTGKWKIDSVKKDIWDINNIRYQRNKAFSNNDKFQLPLVWTKLTDKQKNEYEAWRQDWLDAPETRIIPKSLSF